MSEIPSGAPQFEERPLLPEDIIRLVEITSMVNKVTSELYPVVPPLEMSQVKVVPNVGDVEQAVFEDLLHPFFQEQVGDKVRYSAPWVQSWACNSNNTFYLSGKSIDDMREDKKVGYLGIGIDMITAAFTLGTDTEVVNSEQAKLMAEDMITMSYREVFQLDPADSVAYMRDKGSEIRVNGAQLAIYVEGKQFLPATGIRTNELLTHYLARPVKAAYTSFVAKDFNLNPIQAANIRAYYQRVKPEEKRNEEDLIQKLSTQGIRGKERISSAFITGVVGKKAIDDYQRKA